MKKLFLILIFPSVCFGAGTVRVNQGGTNGATLTIQGGNGGSGGGGTVTDVTAGTNLTGGGPGPSVTLNLDDHISISSATIGKIEIDSDFAGPGMFISSVASGGQFNIRVSSKSTNDSSALQSVISMGAGPSPSIDLFAGDSTAPLNINQSSVVVNRPLVVSTINVIAIRFPDGTIQVSSPTANISGGASVNVSPHSVLFSTGGTTISGNTGLQYDNSVSSLTVNGQIGSYSSSNSVKFIPDNGSADPALAIDDSNGTPGGQILYTEAGTEEASLIMGLSGFTVSVTTGGPGDPSRMIFQRGSQKAYFTTAAGTHVFEIDAVANSTFSIPVVISTLTVANRILWPDGTIQVSSPPASIPGASIYSATATASFPSGASFSTVTFTGPPYVTKTDKYGSASGLCAIYNGCIPASQYSTPTSSTNYVAATFKTGTTSYWQLAVPMNDTFVDGSTFTVNVVWTSTVTSGNVVWNFQALTTTDTLTMDGTYGSLVSVTDTANLNQSFNRSADSGAITPTGPNLHSGQLLLQMYRGAGASDTLSGDARLLWVEVTYYVNRFSSR